MKKQINMILLSAAAVAYLAACSNFVPASQAPRPYTAAHDIVDGQCRDVNLSHKTVVRCPQEAGGVEDAGGVQAANE